MSAAAMAEAMEKAGCTTAQIIAALREYEEGRKAKGRESNRRRQAEFRARRNESNANNASNAVTESNENNAVTPVTSVTEIDAPRARVLCVVNSNIKNKTSNDVLQKGGKGTRIGGDWTPEPRDWHFAISELGDAADRELAKFRDYWIGRAGAGGVKLDWSATWRNWVRKAADDRKARAGPAPKVTAESLLRQAMKIGEFADGGGNSFEPDRTSGPVIEGVGYSSFGGSQRA
jgi:hypothetical protein